MGRSTTTASILLICCFLMLSVSLSLSVSLPRQNHCWLFVVVDLFFKHLSCLAQFLFLWERRKLLPNAYFHLLIRHNCLGKNKLCQNFLSSLWERFSCAKDERSLRKQIKQRTKGEHTKNMLGFNKQTEINKLRKTNEQDKKRNSKKTFFLREELLCCNAIAKATS
jgi:hypothetical protein